MTVKELKKEYSFICLSHFFYIYLHKIRLLYE